jgi:sec-independent protein translocase protein TatC
VPTIRPVAHEARLSLIEHLDELRTRVVWVVLVYVVAFAVCFAFNGQILDQLNKPLAAAKAVDCDRPRDNADALEQTGCFAEQLKVALDVSAPAFADAGDALAAVARTEGVSPEVRAQTARAAAGLNRSARSLEAAAKVAPEATSRESVRPVTLGVTEPFLTTITVAGYAALLLTLPMLLYQLFAFVLPAFTPGERRLAVPVMIAAPFLFVAGVSFGFLLAMPRAIEFLQNYNDGQYDILVQARDYYRFTVVLLAGFGILFQIPLVVSAVVRLQILSPAQLRKTRGYALLIFAILAAVVTPTPDPVTMLLAMAPLVLLYEISIQLARFIVPAGPSRWSMRFDDEDEDDDSPPAAVNLSSRGSDGLD